MLVCILMVKFSDSIRLAVVFDEEISDMSE